MTNRSRTTWLLGGPSRLGPISLLLVVLSLGDLIVTYILLWQGGRYYEANPIARLIFERWNIAGMTLFKFGVIGFVILLGEIIERRRPGVGKAIIGFGCVAATAVIVHGIRLLQEMETQI